MSAKVQIFRLIFGLIGSLACIGLLILGWAVVVINSMNWTGASTVPGVLSFLLVPIGEPWSETVVYPIYLVISFWIGMSLGEGLAKMKLK